MSLDGGEDCILRVFISIDDENLGVSAGTGEGDHHEQNRQDNAGNDGDQGETCAADDADTDGPEEEDQIHGIFDGGAEADDTQGTDHTEADHDIALDGQDDGGGNDRQLHKGEAEAPVIEGILVHHPVHKVDIERDDGGQTDAGEHGADVQFIDGIAFEKGTLEKFFQTHGFLPPNLFLQMYHTAHEILGKSSPEQGVRLEDLLQVAGQDLIPFDFQQALACRKHGPLTIIPGEEVRDIRGRGQLTVKGDADVSTAVNKGNALIGHDGDRPQSAEPDLCQECLLPFIHIRLQAGNLTAEQQFTFRQGEGTGFLQAHASLLAFLFQPDSAGVAVIISDAELAPGIGAGKVLRETAVFRIVQISGADQIAAVGTGVGIPLQDGGGLELQDPFLRRCQKVFILMTVSAHWMHPL